MYNRTHIQGKLDRMKDLQVCEEDDDDNIRLSENLTYVFRMFLISMTIIVLVLSVGT